MCGHQRYGLGVGLSERMRTASTLVKAMDLHQVRTEVSSKPINPLRVVNTLNMQHTRLFRSLPDLLP